MRYNERFKRKETLVRQPIVRQKVKVSFWLDGESYEELKESTDNISKLLDRKPNVSKTLLDATHDFLLDQKLKQQKFEIEDIN